MFLSILVLVIGAILLAVGVGLAVVKFLRYEDENRYSNRQPGDEEPKPELFKQSIPLFVLGGLLIVAALSVVQVNAGEVGIIKRFGKVEGEGMQPGLHFKIPLVDRVLYYNTKQMVYEASDHPDTSKANYTDFSVDTMTQDGQRIKVRFTVVFSVDPDAVAQVANTVGTEQDVVEKIIKSNARSEARNIPKKFSAEDLYSANVYQAQSALAEALIPVYSKNGVILHEFLLRDIGFTEELSQALERKQIALEDATTSERQVEVKRAEAQQKIAEAEGQAQAAIVIAEGQAQAIRLVQDQLSRSSAYSQYLMAKGVSEGSTDIQWIITDGESMPLINMQTPAPQQ